jgi:hypothetical protein
MTFARIDERRHLGSGHSVWLICPARNERALLPDFLRHYRSLGLDTFCFIDNNSDDGSREYLLAQPDCIVFYTDESYHASNFAADWINRVITALSVEGWLVLADADEHLCYAGMETRPIQALLADCEKENADALYAVMVDMYPEGDFLDLRVEPGDRMLDLMPYFDGDYVLRRWPNWPWKPPLGSLQALGGPRCRLLSSLDAEQRHRCPFYMMVNLVDKFVDYVPARLMPALASIWPREVPAQTKAPINLVRPGFKIVNSHAGTNQRLGSELVSLLHFKFCSELQARLRMAAREGNHFRRGLSYLQLEQAVRRWPSRSLAYGGTRRFTSSRDLADIGLVGSRAAVVWQPGSTQDFWTGPCAHDPCPSEATAIRSLRRARVPAHG